MEKLQYHFSTPTIEPANGAVLCGVVGSGNLEVLVRPADTAGSCTIEVATSARGFGEIWQAVLAEFISHHPAGGTHIAINDMGATPAVVTLRLAQAINQYAGGLQ
ncbi:malonate decarboxylase acyl carrier protein [Advenella sp. S44]|uniref:malonate decarboxylase acyl carrier protein n=1 Tax=Advenella sp. S44 TaxID=1982755 RepID=UPI000C296C2B|nr:malonate decarboxylase acyl carrier protein [Advenella sp. S44]PJX25591.1 malonate decarboxylase acyl carrier protein [Advenella sp. S44]